GDPTVAVRFVQLGAGNAARALPLPNAAASTDTATQTRETLTRKMKAARGPNASSAAAELLQPVDDQVEAELVFAAAVAGRGRHVLLAVLREVGVLGSHLLDEAGHPLLDVLALGRREGLRRLRVPELPEREPEDMAVERVVGRVRDLLREPRLAQ